MSSALSLEWVGEVFVCLWFWDEGIIRIFTTWNALCICLCLLVGIQSTPCHLPFHLNGLVRWGFLSLPLPLSLSLSSSLSLSFRSYTPCHLPSHLNGWVRCFLFVSVFASVFVIVFRLAFVTNLVVCLSFEWVSEVGFFLCLCLYLCLCLCLCNFVGTFLEPTLSSVFSFEWVGEVRFLSLSLSLPLPLSLSQTLSSVFSFEWVGELRWLIWSWGSELVCDWASFVEIWTRKYCKNNDWFASFVEIWTRK